VNILSPPRPGLSEITFCLTVFATLEFRFNRPIWHPNIYDTGDLCISILHSGGDDEMSGEKGAERWTPAQRVETVLLSILSLLDDAEPSSPANVEAGKMLRFDIHRYRSVVREHVELSKTDIPEGFVMPATHETSLSKPEIEKEDLDFWADSGDDDDDDDNDDDDDVFGGSDSSDFGDAGDDDGEMELDDAHDDDLDDSDDEDDNNKTKGKE
jgi:ubiquitin-conjugating enzyme E2 R